MRTNLHLDTLMVTYERLKHMRKGWGYHDTYCGENCHVLPGRLTVQRFHIFHGTRG